MYIDFATFDFAAVLSEALISPHYFWPHSFANANKICKKSVAKSLPLNTLCGNQVWQNHNHFLQRRTLTAECFKYVQKMETLLPDQTTQSVFSSNFILTVVMTSHYSYKSSKLCFTGIYVCLFHKQVGKQIRSVNYARLVNDTGYTGKAEQLQKL